MACGQGFPGGMTEAPRERVLALQKTGGMVVPDKSLLSGLGWSELEQLIRAQQRNREVHTPPISTFRWWARRSHALIGALLDEAQGAAAGGQLTVADPF